MEHACCCATDWAMNEGRINTLHLFAGSGGGILADIILGHRPICAVEWEPYACKVLRERVEDGWFPDMRVWKGDVRMFNPSEYAGKVDIIHAGFPCQDISVAGNQAGVGEGSRSGLYREVLRIADVVRPEYIFMENVAAIVTGADGEWLRTIIGDLADRGFDACWQCLAASQVGAKHKRNRWWLLGYSKHARQSATEITGIIEQGNDSDKAGQEQASESTRPSEQHGLLAYPSSEGFQNRRQSRREASNTKARTGLEPESQRCGDNSGSTRAAESSICRMADDVSDWIHPNAWNETEAEVGRVTDERKDRAARLKALGNGQVPLQAAVAFTYLWNIMEAQHG